MMTKSSQEKGFTLIECLIAMVVSLIGFAAILSLLVTCIRTELMSRDIASANSFSRAKIEELKNSPRTAGGSLSSNVNGYYDTPSTAFVRRWIVSNDTSGTQTVTVAILPNVGGTLLPQVELTTRMK
jgi:prepilin-type N-terminal cleavage/methylation domain-containing protein